ncbi:MAG: hypothetical protein NTY91_00830 [Euryarchaeota archaeon]|nr:hypothetical protein [Euryarchaeota archaeon]
MKRFLWLGLLFLSASWLFFIPQFTTPDLVAGSLCVVAGILCFIAGIRRCVQKQVEIGYMVLLVPLAVALVFVSFPYNLGLVVLVIGLITSLFSYKFERIQAVPLGISLAGVLLVIQTIVFPFYVSFISHGHRIDILSPVISSLTNFLGFHTSTNNGLLFVQTLQQIYPVTITWEKLGFFLALNMFLGALFVFVMLYKKRQMLRNMMIFLVAGALYILLRFVAILVLYMTAKELSVFWDPLVTTLSFVPFSLLLMKLLPFKDTTEITIQAPSVHLTKKHLAALILIFLLVFSVTGAFLFQDPGSTKTGRVLIDEYHSQWEDTVRPLDTEWYGLLSTYNYYSWAQWLRYHYSVETNINTTFTPDLLRRYDILILKCPTESYTTQEVQSIKDFVEQGGGLYLIGDHTNVFGMNTFLNQVSEEFGLRYKTDATYELGTGDLSTYTPDLFFSHPVMRHVTQFDFMTSCTLEPTSLSASMRMENIIIGNQIISEPGTYSTENFFRESIASPDSECGYLLQAAAIKYGAGRVVAFTDSTVFSSFCLFTDGYPSFNLGVMDYLNRTNSSTSLNIILFAFSITFFISLLLLLRNNKKMMVLWMFLFAGLLAFSTAAPLCFYLTNLSYPQPMALTDYPHLCFEQQHSSMNISVKPTASLGENSNNYGTFFVWTQRVGAVPSFAPTLNDATRSGDIIVIINPTGPFTEADVHLLTTFFEKGGRLLLVDSIRNPQSTANELLGSFGIWITTTTVDHMLLSNESENTSQISVGNITSPSLIITGGDTLLTNDKNETYATVIDFLNTTTGDVGRLVVVVDSYSFSDALMGGTFTEPTEQQRHIYDTEFFLLRKVLSP